LKETLKVIRLIAAHTTSFLAQAPAPAPVPPGQGQPSALEQFIQSPMSLILIVMVLLWVFVFSSKRKDDKKKKELLSQLKRGDRVQTIGGIIGKVVESDEAKVLLKVDESSNTKIWFSRSAIFKVLGEEKAVEVQAK
jgi:preprotein translocase subunit YajC